MKIAVFVSKGLGPRMQGFLKVNKKVKFDFMASPHQIAQGFVKTCWSRGGEFLKEEKRGLKT